MVALIIVVFVCRLSVCRL